MCAFLTILFACTIHAKILVPDTKMFIEVCTTMSCLLLLLLLFLFMMLLLLLQGLIQETYLSSLVKIRLVIDEMLLGGWVVVVV